MVARVRRRAAACVMGFLILGLGAPAFANSSTVAVTSGPALGASCLADPQACLPGATSSFSGQPGQPSAQGSGNPPSPAGAATLPPSCGGSLAAAAQCASAAGVFPSTVDTACAGVPSTRSTSTLATCLKNLAAAVKVPLPSACRTPSGPAGLARCLQAAGLCGSASGSSTAASGGGDPWLVTLQPLCAPPEVHSAAPDPVAQGGVLVLRGSNLGQSGQASWLPTGSAPVSLTVVSWGAERVTLRVPVDVPSGSGLVVLQIGQQRAQIEERVRPGLLFGPPLPDGHVPVTSAGHTQFVTAAAATRLRGGSPQQAGAVAAALSTGPAPTDGRTEAAMAVARQPRWAPAGAAAHTRETPAAAAPAAISCAALPPITEYGPGHLPFAAMDPQVQVDVPSTTVGGVTLAAGDAYATAYANPNLGTVTAGDWAAGIASARADGLLQLHYVSHACGSRPDPVTVQAKVIMAQWTDAISAEGASCAPLLAVMMVKPQFGNPHWQQRTLASCLSNLSGSVASFPEDEVASQLSGALTTVSAAVDHSLNLYEDYDTAQTILGVLGTTPQVATFTWTGALTRGEGLSVEVGPSAVVGDAGLGEAVNKVAAVALVQITDVPHLTAIAPYGPSAYQPGTFGPAAEVATGSAATAGAMPGLPAYTCPQPSPVPQLGHTSDGVSLAVQPAFYAYLRRQLAPFDQPPLFVMGPNRFQAKYLTLQLRREPGNPWRLDGWRGGGTWRSYPFMKYAWETRLNELAGYVVHYDFFLPPLPAGWYEARPELVQLVKGHGVATNVVADAPLFPLRVFATCPTHGFRTFGSTDLPVAQTPVLVASSPAVGLGITEPALHAVAGQHLSVTLRYPARAAGQWVTLLWNPVEKGMSPTLTLASARVGVGGTVGLHWIASPGEGAVTALGYGTDGGIPGGGSAGLFELDVKAPPVTVVSLPTTPVPAS